MLVRSLIPKTCTHRLRPWRIVAVGFSSSVSTSQKTPGLFGIVSDANKEWRSKVGPAVSPSKTTLTAGIAAAVLASPYTAPYVKAAGQYIAAVAGQPTNQLLHSLHQHLSGGNTTKSAAAPVGGEEVKKLPGSMTALGSMSAVEFLEQLQTIVAQQPHDKTCRQLAQEIAAFCKQQPQPTTSLSSSDTTNNNNNNNNNTSK